MSDPELIEQFKLCEARFQKIDAVFFVGGASQKIERGFFWRRQPRNFKTNDFAVRRREHFQVFFGGFF